MSPAMREAFSRAWYDGHYTNPDVIEALAEIKASDACTITLKLLTGGFMDSTPEKGVAAVKALREALEREGR
jgi:hypothetical protein